MTKSDLCRADGPREPGEVKRPKVNAGVQVQESGRRVEMDLNTPRLEVEPPRRERSDRTGGIGSSQVKGGITPLRGADTEGPKRDHDYWVVIVAEDGHRKMNRIQQKKYYKVLPTAVRRGGWRGRLSGVNMTEDDA